MKQIFEEYGEILLQVIGGAGVLWLLYDLLSADGALHGLITRVLSGGC